MQAFIVMGFSILMTSLPATSPWHWVQSTVAVWTLWENQTKQGNL